MQARRNVAGLSPQERQHFIDAIIELKTRPSQRGLANRYDDYVRVHTDAMNVPISWGHGGPAFTAWHRVLLHKFEEELRSIDPGVSIPFWDWTVDRTATSAPWFSDLLGGDGGPTNPAGSDSGEVVTGPLRHSAGDWDITTGDPGTNDDPLDRPYLARGFGRRSDATQLPTPAAQTTALNQSPYSQFLFDLEVPLHNRVHRWVNGQMILRASPQDPVFWLHHCNIDRLWGIWMRGRPAAQRYTAAAGDPSFHQPTGTMIFLAATLYGVGKTFFMRLMQETVSSVAGKRAMTGQDGDFVSRAAQIEFNAWHFVDSDLWASLASHIFDGLSKELSGPKETVEDIRRQLRRPIQSSQRGREEAAAAIKTAQDERQQAAKELEKKQDERARVAARHESEHLKRVWNAVRSIKPDSKDPDRCNWPDVAEMKERAENASRRLGLTKVINSVEEVHRVHDLLQDLTRRGTGLAKAFAAAFTGGRIWVSGAFWIRPSPAMYSSANARFTASAAPKKRSAGMPPSIP